MATDRPFWQRHLKLLGVALLTLVCAVVALVFTASPRLAAMLYEAGRFHPVFIGIRLTLYALLFANWRRIAHCVNRAAQPDSIRATRHSLMMLVMVFEFLTALPYLSR
jgi:hypothetical protein